ncbi:MAG TPA: hypothetical protein PLL09_04715 [Flavobacterium sp.]|uniref:hypothetical protein n=1 Tax=unclassified Flavobacterium TaxID=196869 RepID=UPI0025C6DCB3|nr:MULTISPECIES: hypothetical protein [unclassified Flavobacterium]HRE77111.1 hypothetical protein [Flavobacterium sp.]
MRIKLIDVDNRLKIKFNEVDGIWNWGDDNCYPSLVKSIINSSPTAKQCVSLNAKYATGKGFEFAKDITNKSDLIVNKRGLTINQLLRMVNQEFAYYNNVFLHINYNSLFEVTSVQLLPATDVRIAKTDSNNYNGKYKVYNNWDGSKSKKHSKNDYDVIDRFNPNPEIIQAQVDACGGVWSKYKGQILHINSDFSELYSLSDVDSVLADADSEFKAQEFRNDSLRKGFAGNKIIVTKPFQGGEEEADEFQETLTDLRGTSGILMLEATGETDDLSKEIFIQNLESNIDSKTFQVDELSAEKNILKAFGVPSILVNQDSDSVFGNSGELLKEAKKTLWENREEEREIIVDAFQQIFSRFHKPLNPENNWNIIPILEKEVSSENNIG